MRTIMMSLTAAGLLLAGGATPSYATDGEKGSADPAVFSSKACVSQVKEAAQKMNLDPDRYLDNCQGKVVVENIDSLTMTKTEAMNFVKQQDLDPKRANQLVAAANAGAVHGTKWKQTYWGGSIVEKHAGTTWWDGKYAWTTSRRGATGRHKCHTEGSWAVGFAVETVNCNHPSPGVKADSINRFDVSFAVKGSPISFGVGLHNQYTKNGKRSTWQVGG